jgi:hypothetical protein
MVGIAQGTKIAARNRPAGPQLRGEQERDHEPQQGLDADRGEREDERVCAACRQTGSRSR